MHGLSNRDTLVLRQRTETFIMSIHKDDLDYANKSLDEIVDLWIADNPKLLEEHLREEIEFLAKKVKKAADAGTL